MQYGFLGKRYDCCQIELNKIGSSFNSGNFNLKGDLGIPTYSGSYMK